MSMLERRIAKVEEAVRPVPEQRIRILIEPATDASPEEWAAHHREIETAKAEADRVFLVTSKKPEFWKRSDGVEMFVSAIEAQLAMLGAQRSQRGNKNRLADVIEDLGGNVIKAVDDPLPAHWRAGE